MATIEIDGKPCETSGDKMIIEVADENGVSIPRFCYHKKLSIAANCRMCLVEVDNVRKPVPACATPIADGMKVYTKSPLAIGAQKSVMEFLLINHPLDCPICDQGGECELQDVSMGYGGDISRFNEGKRAVDDEDIGPLISTEMTRCIHCTRCVRFGEEVAGLRELGATGRGENTKIGTFIKHSLQSEISANVIDLCPVGALTNKPYRYTARSWEMQQKPAVAAHDCLGSNIHFHVRRQEVMRVVPRDNESINETWISDRDRFSYLGMKHEDRLALPLVKQNGQWIECDWETGLTTAVLGMKKVLEKHGADEIAGLAHPSNTLEEFYLLQKLLRSIGTNNIDHRIREVDFLDQNEAPLFPQASCAYADIENKQSFLLVGSCLHREQPLAAVRLRKAVMQQDAKVMAIDAVAHPFNFTIDEKIICHPKRMTHELAAVLKAALDGSSADSKIAAVIESAQVEEHHRVIAKQIAQDGVIILGALALHHPDAACLRALAKHLAEVTGADIICMTDGANAQGAWLAGAVPHRTAGGKAIKKAGLSASDMLAKQLKAYLLFGLEPELDCANPGIASTAVSNAEFVVCCSPYRSESMMKYADVILPIATHAETSGTFINIDAQWQTFHGAVKPFGEARPGWKVLRVMGNLFDKNGFDYVSSAEVLADVKAQTEKVNFESKDVYVPEQLPEADTSLTRVCEWPIYQVDGQVRRSQALQESATNDKLEIHVSPEVAKQFNLRHGKPASVMQVGAEVMLPVNINENIAENTVLVAGGYTETSGLAISFGPIDLK